MRFRCNRLFLIAAAAAFFGARTHSPASEAVSFAFREVNPRRSSPEFRSYIGRALEHLRGHPSRIGRLTYESIAGGRVRVDEMSDLTSWDFWRISRSLPRWGVELGRDDYFRLARPQSGISKRIELALDAYMWGDRIYVANGVGPEALAAVLVHEVNHVLNGAERDYYDRWPVNAFLHEYRAFYAEKLFDPSKYRNIDLADYVMRLYGFARSAIPEPILGQPLTGLLYPTKEAWEFRRVESDPLDDCWLSPVYG